MKIKRTIAALLLLPLTALSLAAGPYAVGAADADFKTLLTRWATLEGKRLVWEAEGNATISDPEAINNASKLPYAKSFHEAMSRLDHVLDSPMLMACMFDDAIVIRTTKQPGCGQPLN